VDETQYAGAGDRKVSISWGHGKVIRGEDYVLQVSIPTTADAILRHNGVDIGKMDFLGPINLIVA
jgi:hypothetical protein